jgi:hypothetical protein
MALSFDITCAPCVAALGDQFCRCVTCKLWSTVLSAVSPSRVYSSDPTLEQSQQPFATQSLVEIHSFPGAIPQDQALPPRASYAASYPISSSGSQVAKPSPLQAQANPTPWSTNVHDSIQNLPAHAAELFAELPAELSVELPAGLPAETPLSSPPRPQASGPASSCQKSPFQPRSNLQEGAPSTASDHIPPSTPPVASIENESVLETRPYAFSHHFSPKGYDSCWFPENQRAGTVGSPNPGSQSSYPPEYPQYQPTPSDAGHPSSLAMSPFTPQVGAVGHGPMGTFASYCTSNSPASAQFHATSPQPSMHLSAFSQHQPFQMHSMLAAVETLGPSSAPCQPTTPVFQPQLHQPQPINSSYPSTEVYGQGSVVLSQEVQTVALSTPASPQPPCSNQLSPFPTPHQSVQAYLPTTPQLTTPGSANGKQSGQPAPATIRVQKHGSLQLGRSYRSTVEVYEDSQLS